MNVLASINGFFSSSTWHVSENLLIFFAVVFWAALGYWVYKDARRRIEDPLLVGVATLVGLVPPYLGPFVYMLFRPPEYLDDRRERELEMRAIESRLGPPEMKCKVCGCEVEPDFLVCPVCTTKLRSACGGCNRPLEPAWQVCPYCATPVPVEAPVALAPKVRRTRTSTRTPSSG